MWSTLGIDSPSGDQPYLTESLLDSDIPITAGSSRFSFFITLFCRSFVPQLKRMIFDISDSDFLYTRIDQFVRESQILAVDFLSVTQKTSYQRDYTLHGELLQVGYTPLYHDRLQLFPDPL
jgi:hypothetical protein